MRGERVAVWVGEKRPGRPNATLNSAKVKIPGLSQETRQARGNVKGILRRRNRTGMDITWLTHQIAVGGGIWNAENMAKVAEEGITHIIDMQIEFDDTALAAKHDIAVLWNPTDDDFDEKPAELFRRGVDFARQALASNDAKVFVHCAAGVHRAPMMALALLGSMGWELKDAMDLIERKRPVADFADVYVESVEKFLDGQQIPPRR